jgi:acetyl esterase
VALSDECRGALESLVLFYPVTKAFADGSGSWRKYGSGYGLDADLMEAFNRAYLGGTDSENHAVSVGLCSGEQLRRLPRTLLVAAGRDILRDQGCELAEKSGGRIERVEFPDAVHLFITVPGQDEAFRKAVDLTYEFITQKQ